MSELFHFKQFSINQDKTAMKVGTDGVLLGAWAQINETVQTVLDIGSGTGLLGLQIAQRCNAAQIDAIELEENAYEQCVENFENSQWADRLFCYHASFQEFVDEIDEQYDLIISNPPFYNHSYKELPNNRAMARHTDNLSFETLIKGTSKLLSQQGSAAFIIPFDEEIAFLELAKTYKLFPNRITQVRGNNQSPLKRSLLQFSFNKTSAIEKTELQIETSRHQYTKAYTNLVQEFYSKM